jgi:ABC-type antimicrobial peptide transport system permease subunit
MWINIRERTREIGTLRAVGMQRGSVLAMFVVEAMVLGVISTVVGGLLGVALAAGLTASEIHLPPSWQFVFFSEVLVISPTLPWVSLSIGFITLSITAISILPSFLAARLKPITAMSHVG